MNPRSERVSIPVPLFAAMSSCYFGSGPRFTERNQEPPPPVEARDEGPTLFDSMVDPSVIQHAPSLARATPGGYAARKARPPATVKEEDKGN